MVHTHKGKPAISCKLSASRKQKKPKCSPKCVVQIISVNVTNQWKLCKSCLNWIHLGGILKMKVFFLEFGYDITMTSVLSYSQT